MGEVVELNAKRRDPYLAGYAVCLACKHKWEFVAPVGSYELECPSCGSMRGVSSTHIYPDDGVPRFQCGHCKTQLWTIRPEGISCAGCGILIDWDAVFPDEE